MKYIIVKPCEVGTLYLRSITRSGKVWSLSYGDAKLLSPMYAKRLVKWGEECIVPIKNTPKP